MIAKGLTAFRCFARESPRKSWFSRSDSVHDLRKDTSALP